MIFKRGTAERARRFRCVRGYVPERRFTQSKAHGGMRECREELAVADARTYRVLALRQCMLPTGTSVGEEAFYRFRGFEGIAQSLIDEAIRHCRTHRVALLDRGRHCLMLYFPAVEETGTFLAIDFAGDMSELRRGLWLIGMEEVLLLPAPPCAPMRALRNDGALCERMQELFGLLRGIYDRSLSVASRLQLLSELAGCPLPRLPDRLAMPFSGGLQEDRRLFSALLCLLLEKRYENARAGALPCGERTPRFLSHPSFAATAAHMKSGSIAELLCAACAPKRTDRAVPLQDG